MKLTDNRERVAVDAEMIASIGNVRVEDCSPDAQKYIDVIESAVIDYLDAHKLISVPADELSTLVGDCDMDRGDAMRLLAVEHAWYSIVEGWRPEARLVRYEPHGQSKGPVPAKFVAGHYTYVDGKTYPCTWGDLADMGLHWSIAFGVASVESLTNLTK
jgi:hypothetical protein